MRFYISLFSVFASLTLIAQDVAPNLNALGEPGTFSLTWFEDNPYKADSSIHAYVLTHRVQSQLRLRSPNYVLTTKHRKIVRILDRSGTDEATVSFTIYNPVDEQKLELVKDLKAFTYTKTENGVKVTELTEANIHSTRLNNLRERITLSFPNVANGSIIDYSYQQNSSVVTRLDRIFVQEQIPVQEAYVSLISPSNFSYKGNFSGLHPLKNRSSKKADTRYSSKKSADNLLEFWAHDIPALLEEPYVSTLENYLTSIDLELSQHLRTSGELTDYAISWPAIAKGMRDMIAYKEATKGNKFYNNWAQTYSGDDKLMDKYDWAFIQVSRKIAWNNFISTYSNRKPGKIVDEGVGTTAEINFILLGLLHALDIEAYPVFLSTRSNGFLFENLQSKSALKTTIVAVPKGNKYIFADASRPFSAPGILPFGDLNGKGLMVMENNIQFVDLQAGANGLRNLSASLRITEDNTLKGTAKFRLSGQLLKEYLTATTTGYSFDDSDLDLLPGFTFNVTSVKESGRMQYEITADIESLDPLLEVDGALAFSPSIDGTWRKNPFSPETRKYPVEFAYGFIYNRKIDIDIPEGYTLNSTPESTLIKTENGKCSYRYQIVEGVGSLSIQTSLSVRQLHHDVNQYGALRSVFDLMAKKEQELISLKMP